ncbi:MAG: DUF2339 domain-containing protein [Elusimicrobia bacterium]|nr:DUF2339 domain-containing protein [Elusimicrobiota bacterium]
MEQDAETLRDDLRALRLRIDRIEKKLGLGALLAPTVKKKEAPVPEPALLPAAQLDASEGGQAGKALGIIAVVCFVVAASFLIRLAIDAGWLTAERQLGLAASLGVALIVAGLSGPIKDADYLSLLPAGGLIILYLTAYGGALYYKLYSTGVAAIAVSGISLGALVLLPVPLLQHPLFTGITVAGTYLGSLLLPEVQGTKLASMVFFLGWDVAFAFWAASLRSREMLLMASYLGLGCFAASAPEVFWGGEGPLAQTAGFQFLQFLAFCGGVAYQTHWTGKPMTSNEAWGFFPVLLFFYVTEYALLWRLAPGMAPWASFSFAGVVYAVYSLSKEALRSEALESGAIVSAFLAVVLLHAGYFELVPERWAPWCGVLVAGSAMLARPADLRGANFPFVAAGGIVVLINIYKTCFGIGLPGIGQEEVVALNGAFAAALLGAYVFVPWETDKTELDLRGAALWVGTAEAMVGAWNLAEISKFGPFGVTLLWALLGAGLLLFAGTRGDRLQARTGLAVLAAAAGKALLFDVAMSQPVVRIGCLLALGALLYVSGFLLRQMESWKR